MKGIKSDGALVILILTIAALLLFPMPTVAIDFLLVINLAFSLLLLIVAIYTPDIISFAAFPAVLLVLTVFRLGLNVASTRLILLQADAGDVIRSFGELLIRGEPIIGLIIFAIITTVNFIVIARGASRIAEVSARFALDAMPGKQIAIDADLRAGNIDTAEAKLRRERLSAESDTFGAMDGAMNFVRGDAIAGIIIVFVNILGGLALAISRGMPLDRAFSTYTILTVGDGLVTQMPALLVALAAGLIVSKISTTSYSSFSEQVVSYLLPRPYALVLSGAVITFLGLFSELPKLPFLSVGIVLAAFGYSAYRRTSQQTQIQLSKSVPNQKAIEIVLPYAPQQEQSDLDPIRLQRIVSNYRQEFFTNFGVNLPIILVLPERKPGASTITIKSGGRVLYSEKIPVGCRMIEANPNYAPILRAEVRAIRPHPIGAGSVFWTDTKVSNELPVRVFSIVEYGLLCLTAVAQDEVEEFVGFKEVSDIISEFDERWVAGLVNGKQLDITKLTIVLRKLLAFGLNIRSNITIEAILGYFAERPPEEDYLSIDDLVAFVLRATYKHWSPTLDWERAVAKFFYLDELVDLRADKDSARSKVAKIAASVATYLKGSATRAVVVGDIQSVVFARQIFKQEGVRAQFVIGEQLPPEVSSYVIEKVG